MEWDTEGKTVDSCAACEWDHENVAFFSANPGLYFKCPLTLATVRIAPNGSYRVVKAKNVDILFGRG